jgi:hypothetical protein
MAQRFREMGTFNRGSDRDVTSPVVIEIVGRRNKNQHQEHSMNAIECNYKMAGGTEFAIGGRVRARTFDE